jgi:hypothetical protein
MVDTSSTSSSTALRAQVTSSQFSSSSLVDLITTATLPELLAAPKSTSRPKLETIRKKFPDTWLFLNVSAEYVKS